MEDSENKQQLVQGEITCHWKLKGKAKHNCGKKEKKSRWNLERELLLFWHKTNLICTPELWRFLIKKLVWTVLVLLGVVRIIPFIMIEDLSVWDRHAHQMYASRSSKKTTRQQKTRPSGRAGGGQNCMDKMHRLIDSWALSTVDRFIAWTTAQLQRTVFPSLSCNLQRLCKLYFNKLWVPQILHWTNH